MAISNVIKPSKAKAFIKTIVSTVVENLTFSKSTNLLITFNGTSLKMAGHSMSAVIAALLWVNLPEKLKRNTKIHRVRKNKKKLGRSIEQRPQEVNKRNVFGHWECDLVLGHKTKDDEVLLTMSERMSREFLIIKIPDKTAASVMNAFKSLRKQYSEHWNDIFKTITTDNGSEFADLSQLEDIYQTLVYYAHPYTSCDKGTVERHNGLIRRFIPKGDYIHNYSLQQIINIETWCNSLPRKILAYHTPDEIFERELDQIYQTA